MGSFDFVFSVFPLIFGAVFIFVVVIIVITAVRSFKSAFNSKTLKQVVDEGNFIDENVPKSIGASTSLFLPQITRDFPEFNWNEYLLKTQNTLKSVLMAQSTRDMSLLPDDVNDDLRSFVSLSIEDDRAGGIINYVDDITVYKTEITDYRKTGGTCVISTRSSVGCLQWKERDGTVVSGSKERRKQTRYDLEIVYIQNRDKAGAYSESAIGLNCPNCGAPITSLGVKFCEHCGSAVVEMNIKVWRFGRISEC